MVLQGMSVRVEHTPRRIQELNIRKRTFVSERHQVMDLLGEGAWNESLTFQDHVCVSFQLLDQDLREDVEDRGEVLLLPERRSVAGQEAAAVQHLSSLRTVHADARHFPENESISPSVLSIPFVQLLCSQARLHSVSRRMKMACSCVNKRYPGALRNGLRTSEILWNCVPSDPQDHPNS